jgi:hypothetical protein
MGFESSIAYLHLSLAAVIAGDEAWVKWLFGVFIAGLLIALGLL